MTEKKFSIEEINGKIKELDDYISVLFPDQEPIEIGIVGGVSFIMSGLTSREVTRDADSFIIKREETGTKVSRIEAMINQLGLDHFFNSSAYMFSGIIEFENEWVEHNNGKYRKIRVFFPSIEIMICLKIKALISRNSDNDYLDIYNETIMSKEVNIQRLRELINEWHGHLISKNEIDSLIPEAERWIKEYNKNKK